MGEHTGSGRANVPFFGLTIGTPTFWSYHLELVASNDDWQTDSRASEVATLPTHLKLTSPTDAGLLLDLPVGAYTVTLSSVGTKRLGLVGIDLID
ncbi:hypothetical protein [Candidatus Parabeggiatoa sp. HSG14]|uniref:hypothetical protein n=1 Tax=Candidatus Parabeggiatoa sp. HSG14 TaxID=3055593 RepID=UPI0025A71B22|nr:hypothetical protein [Thiotrichales bacterium HSG14]